MGTGVVVTERGWDRGHGDGVVIGMVFTGWSGMGFIFCSRTEL